jgi:hypothetical protein
MRVVVLLLALTLGGCGVFYEAPGPEDEGLHGYRTEQECHFYLTMFELFNWVPGVTMAKESEIVKDTSIDPCATAVSIHTQERAQREGAK